MAATTNLGKLTKALEERFGYVFYLDEYTEEELTQIVQSITKKMSFELPNKDIKEIVDSSRGTPRNTLRILMEVQDYYLTNEKASMQKIIKECGFIQRTKFNRYQIFIRSARENLLFNFY